MIRTWQHLPDELDDTGANSYYVAAEIARFDSRLKGVSTVWQKPSSSLPGIYPPAAPLRPNTPDPLSPIKRARPDAAMPRPRPLSFFSAGVGVPNGSAGPRRVLQMSSGHRVRTARPILVPLRASASTSGALLQQRGLKPLSSHPLPEGRQPNAPAPPRQLLDARQLLAAQLRHFVLQDLGEDMPNDGRNGAMLLEAAHERIIECFRAWDTDANGCISRYEFAKSLRVLGFPANHEEMEGLFATLDADHSGSIQIGELQAALSISAAATPAGGKRPPPGAHKAAAAPRPKGHEWNYSLPLAGQLSDLLLAQMREVIQAFSEWDADGSAGLSHGEFRRAMGALGLRSNHKIEKLWKEFDRDGSGEVVYEELSAALAPKGMDGLMSMPRSYMPQTVDAAKINAELKAGVTAKVRSAAEQMHEAFGEMATERVLDVFQAWDVDGGGSLSRAEFAAAMVRLGVKTTKAQLNKLFNELDPDHSGTIKHNELYWAVKERRGYAPGHDHIAKPGARWE